eukprot:CAMPEP_0178937540 /NCGR_PEP_ID=MMETSP0786-20121207/25819_1 /TAXON_ID=186022 /ORGANISM="Thalassionema frauenfeldii, Strain CCMP 1798" /LENGTH=265 /DNA_ID=CAMNT_0020616133 /DNA_START=398 /DNA_END=1192 /DNA_ORIENTATION=-
MPPGGFGARGHGKEAVSLLPRSFAADVLRVKKEENKSGHPENIMMDAAHHLAFLKHASPARKTTTYPGTDAHRETSSMPSLAPCSSGTTSSPDEEGSKRRIGLETGGVNTLLMAAYAMTELTEPSAPSTPVKEIKVLPFSSPKRKSSNVVASSDDQYVDADNTNEAVKGDGVGQHSVQNTPGEERRIKRTRMGTVDRKNLDKESNEADKEIKTENIPPTSSAKPVDLPTEDKEESEYVGLTITTPKEERKSETIPALTPISARCI